MCRQRFRAKLSSHRRIRDRTLLSLVHSLDPVEDKKRAGAPALQVGSDELSLTAGVTDSLATSANTGSGSCVRPDLTCKAIP